MAIGLATLPSAGNASLLFEYAKRNLVYGLREGTPTNYVTGKKLHNRSVTYKLEMENIYFIRRENDKGN